MNDPHTCNCPRCGWSEVPDAEKYADLDRRLARLENWAHRRFRGAVDGYGVGNYIESGAVIKKTHAEV